jgi:hypothetical protein
MWRRARIWTARVQFPAQEKDISLLHTVKTTSGAHLASYPVDIVRSFPGGKVAEASSAEVKNGIAIPLLTYMPLRSGA